MYTQKQKIKSITNTVPAKPVSEAVQAALDLLDEWGGVLEKLAKQ